MSTPIDIPASSVVPSPRNTWQALARGFAGRCPACGKGSIFGAYLKVRHACETCGTELHHHRADDAPPYFTMLIVGHIVVGGVLSVERMYAPSLWVHMALWVPLTLGLSLVLLPIVKGGLIGLQWALRMHGFGGGADPAEPSPEPAAPSANRGGAR
ncbi:MAG: DUF983 domain-containing protein [Hyphomicrobium sp.]